jgi:hypothetical protein
MIDFTTLFAKTTVERLSFRTRRNVNYKHEVIFLSSYLHDARFKRSDFIESRGKITIKLERDCWEFFTRIHKVKDLLLFAPSILTICGVDECRWSRRPDKETVSIRSVFVGERQYLEQGTAHLVFDCPYQNIRIDVIGNDDYFDIKLEDQDDPK